MKLWMGYGSEHSMKLVMIGHFKDPQTAQEAQDVLEALKEEVLSMSSNGTLRQGSGRYSDGLLDLLRRVNIYDISPEEMEHFAYEFSSDAAGSDVTLQTDESDVSAFLKVFLNRGARVEVYSSHDYPQDPTK